jgi:hypothetical protein
MLFRMLTRSACIVAVTLTCFGIAGNAQAPQPSPAALAAAKEVLQLKGSLTFFEPVIPGVIEQAKNLFLQTNPNLGKELNEAAATLRTELAPRREQVTDEVARLYAQKFTEQELKDTVAFFKSPLGKKILVQEPAFVEQSLTFAQDWANKLSEEVIVKMRAEMKKKGHDL